jgi:hypothetical protein
MIGAATRTALRARMTARPKSLLADMRRTEIPWSRWLRISVARRLHKWAARLDRMAVWIAPEMIDLQR